MRWIVVLVLLWPIPHRVLVETRELDPWELFGWAMYSVPHPRIEVGVRPIVGGVEREALLAGRNRELLRDWVRRRTTLGSWVREERLARDLLALNPSWEGVSVELVHWRLDPATARLDTRSETLRFLR